MSQLTPWAATVVIALAACSSNEPTEIRPATIVAFQGSGQSGTPGITLPESLVVIVKDRDGQPVAGVTVNWVGQDAAVLSPVSDTTDASGRVAAEWKLGLIAGSQTATASVSGLPGALFTADAQAFVADTVSGGLGYACARTGTAAYCWGFNLAGNLGDGSTTLSSLPVLVSGSISWSMVVASIGLNTCGIATGGALYCWGDNTNGASGTGLAETTILTPTPVASAESFSMVDAAGFYSSGYTCAITTLQLAQCWGRNVQGRLGTGGMTDQTTPTAVADTFHFSSIYAGQDRTCALTPEGAAYCWGLNSGGTLGATTPGIHPSPVPVGTQFTFKQIAVMSRSACGLELNGSVRCWGWNFFGALGSGSSVDSTFFPLQVSGGMQFKQIVSRGGEAVFALALDGRLFYWGSPGGDVSQDVPVAFAPTLRFRSIADADMFGNSGFCGIEESGIVYCGEPYSGRVEAVPIP